MLIVLGLFFLIVWLVFLKFKWLPFNRTWMIIIWTTALAICLVVLGALQHYAPSSQQAVVEASAQRIYPVVSGYVDEVFVSDSEPVSEGDKLFTIDPRPFQYEVDNWTATLKLAEIALDDAKTLVEKDAIARYALDQRQADRDRARAELSTAEYNLENTVVNAPDDGIVSLATLRPGQRVDPSSVAINFIGAGEIWIAAAFKQNGLGRLAAGLPVLVVFSSAPGVIYDSEVVAVPAGIVQGQITPEDAADPFRDLASATDAWPVRIALPKNAPDELARPGSLAQVTVFTDDGNPINHAYPVDP
jgi:multidrug resistance efflux pump